MEPLGKGQNAIVKAERRHKVDRYAAMQSGCLRYRLGDVRLGMSGREQKQRHYAYVTGSALHEPLECLANGWLGQFDVTRLDWLRRRGRGHLGYQRAGLALPTRVASTVANQK